LDCLSKKIKLDSSYKLCIFSISKARSILYRIRDMLTNTVLLMLYYTMIFPYITYCNIAWGSAKPSILQKVIVLHKRTVRLVARSSYCSATRPLFFRLEI
jgi:hypothetical protein